MKKKHKFICKYCNRKFEKKKSLTNHIRWHNLPQYKEYQETFKKYFSKVNLGKNNGMWKGDKVGKDALHEWIKNHKPKPKLCVRCKKKSPYDLANISGEYKRDINDFEWICRSCHMKEDGRVRNFYSKGKNRGNQNCMPSL